MVREILEITPLTSLAFGIAFVFGIVALLIGLFGAVVGSGRSRAMGFLEAFLGWIALFAVYLFLWNWEHLITATLTLLGGLIGTVVALGLLAILIMKT